MAEQIITKRCSTCKQIKPVDEFPKSKNGKYGYHNQCKTCHNEQVRNYSKTEKGKDNFRIRRKKYENSPKGKVRQKVWNAKYYKTEKWKIKNRRYRTSEKGLAKERRYYKSKKRRCHNKLLARHTVANAVRSGKFPVASSNICNCGNQAVEYHHHLGYEPEHWLDVIPVCINCHLHIHGLIKS